MENDISKFNLLEPRAWFLIFAIGSGSGPVWVRSNLSSRSEAISITRIAAGLNVMQVTWSHDKEQEDDTGQIGY